MTLPDEQPAPAPAGDEAASVAPGAALPLDPQAAVAVVVVNHNGGDKLVQTLEAITNQPHAVAQVIVVDSASTDGSADAAEASFPDAQVIKLDDNVGPCVTRNTGVEQCKAPLVLLLDSDVYVDGETIDIMTQAQRETGAAIVCPRILLLPGANEIQCEGATNHFLGTSGMRHGWLPKDQVQPERASVPGAISAALLVDRAFYQKSGGFDPLYYFYYEDLEFGLRTKLLGGQIICEPTAIVLHDRGGGTPGLSFRGKGGYPQRRMFLQLRNRSILMLIHFRLRTLIVLSPALFVYEGVSLLAAFAKGAGRQWFKAWADVVRLRREIGERRQKMQQRRVIADKAVLEGGPIPLAPGFVRNKVMAGGVRVLNACFGAYWSLAKRLIG